MYEMNTLRELRMERVDVAAKLRESGDRLAWTTAAREQFFIERAGGVKGLGTNAEAQKSTLTALMGLDPAAQDYRDALNVQRSLERRRDELDALIEAQQDERQAEQWRVRAKLADALMGQAIAPDHGKAGDDSSFQAVQDEQATAKAQWPVAKIVNGGNGNGHDVYGIPDDSDELPF